MGRDELDLTSLLDWEDGLPYPRWDLVEAWIETRRGEEDRPAAWDDVSRQWLAELGLHLAYTCELAESEHFLMLAPASNNAGEILVSFAEGCRRHLHAVLEGIARLDVPRKQVVLALGSRPDYYRYISRYYTEGPASAVECPGPRIPSGVALRHVSTRLRRQPYARRVGAARGHLARLAASPRRLARQVRRHPLGLRRDRPPPCSQ